MNSLDKIKSLRIHNYNNIIFAYLNINSIRNKFENLRLIINENVDILCIAETKIDESFPTAQFVLPGYHKPYRLDISDRQGGLLVYIKSHLPSRLLSTHPSPKDIQAIPFELNLRKEKWMFVCIYRPPKQSSQYFLDNLSLIIDHYSGTYDNYIVLGDFNIDPKNSKLTSFMQSFNLYNLIKSNTCFKGGGSCIDLILTNRKYCFKHTSTFETGLSDHHHLIYSMLKTTFKKEEPKQFIYRDYKNFDKENFYTDLESQLSNCSQKYEHFENTFVEVLNAHAPKKTKILRGNQKPHVDKNLRKAIMKRSKLKNKANRTKQQEDIINYKKQRNLVVKLNRESKLQYFGDIDTSKNSKPFWNKCKPYFSNKHAHGDNKIILIEKENITTNTNEVVQKETLLVNNDEIANTFNKHFSETVKNLNTFEWPTNDENIYNENLTAIIKKFENHPSIMKIKSKYVLQEKFSLKPVTVKDVEIIIKNMPNNKASGGEIPLNILKQSGITYKMLTDCINDAIITEDIFPDNLKFADVTPVHKKDETTNKENYRPVSVLPLISKIFERIIYDQLSSYLEKYLNNILCGFRKAHSTQHALFKLLQAWQEELDKSGLVGTILMDLSKAYDCLPHDLLIAKLEAYGVDKGALKLISNYLSNRKQRTKVGSSYSSWYEILRGVPQGSILGPLLFNIFINDLFLFIEKSEICNFADDNTIYNCNDNLENILQNLEFDMKNILKWFKVNSMKANPKKFQFMILGKSPRQTIILNINDIKIRESQKVELLGLIIDNKLTFKDHINTLCRRASYKLHALRRIRKYLTFEKAKLLCNAFINSQFNYASIIWMFCRKQDYLKIQNIHYKALKIVYNSNESYEELLMRNNEVSIHQKQLRALATEIYKSLTDTNPEFMKDYFSIKVVPYTLRNRNALRIPPARSTYYGTNSIHFRACLLWNMLPNSLKESQSLLEFKYKIKRIRKIDCSCTICRTW